ncbi:MAG: ABC transporter ATP-binding protein, partial [Oscillospiraceae bacterium]|nr:ABC transporter ATP-binding protein [Oscillospiraceae bacterium]
ENLSKYYGNKKAVNSISFKASDGEILGFLGPNGAGKTTTMNMLTGYISATSGRALINGIDVLENPIAAKRNLGYLPENPPLYLDMTVDEYLRFVYELKKCKMPRNSHLDELRELTNINDVRGRLIANLSKGYRQRVGIAGALVGNPKVLILDEPTVGLDPNQIIEIRNLLKQLGKDHTMVMSSHILSEIKAVCDRIVIINEGTIAADDTPENLTKELSGNNALLVRVEGEPQRVCEVLREIESLDEIKTMDSTEPGAHDYELTAKVPDIRRDVSALLAANNLPLLMMKTNELTLEEIFIKLTNTNAADIPKEEEESEICEEIVTDELPESEGE